MIDNTTSLSPVEKAKAEFSAHLLDLVREQCDPSYRDLAKTSSVSKTTICRILANAHFPKWRTVQDLLVALEVDKEEIDTTWKRRWIDTKDVIKPRPGHDTADETRRPALRVLNRRRETA
jgi:predicted transcriptional regulator